jgi:hypothetical protein
LTTAQSALNVAQEALNTASDAKTLTEKNLIDGVNTLISKQENIVAPLKTAYEDAQSALEICDANIKEKNIALNVLDKAKSDALSDSDYIAADTLVSQRKEAYDKKVEENQTALQDKQTALATTSGNLAAANTELAKYDEGIIMRSESKINKQTCNWVFTCYDWTITYTIEGGGEYWKAKVSAEGLTFNSTKQITAPDISKTIYYLYLQQEIENGDAADRIKTAYNVAKSTVENAIASLFDTTYTSAKIDAQSAKDTAQTNYGDALSAYNAAAQATASDEYNAWQNASTDKDTLYKNFIKDAQAAYDAEPGCNDRETKYNVVYGYSIEGIGHIPGTKKTYE